MDPEPIDLIAALKHLSTTHRQAHESRIGREFQLVITMLTFFVLCVAAKFAGHIQATGPLFKKILTISLSGFDFAIWLAFIILTFAACKYLSGSAQANRKNQAIAEAAEEGIELCVKGKDAATITVDLDKLIKSRESELENRSVHPCRGRWKLEASIIAVGAFLAALLTTLG